MKKEWAAGLLLASSTLTPSPHATAQHLSRKDKEHRKVEEERSLQELRAQNAFMLAKPDASAFVDTDAKPVQALIPGSVILNAEGKPQVSVDADGTPHAFPAEPQEQATAKPNRPPASSSRQR
jgi:hypothetical protein